MTDQATRMSGALAPDWAELSEDERVIAAEKQCAFIRACYEHAAKLRGPPKSVRPYSGLLGYGHDLSDEARQDIKQIERLSGSIRKPPWPRR